MGSCFHGNSVSFLHHRKVVGGTWKNQKTELEVFPEQSAGLLLIYFITKGGD